MTRLYDDPVDVRHRDGVPAEFLWRGRLYVVRDVLDHWVETGAWWQGGAAQELFGTASGTSPSASSAAPSAAPLGTSSRNIDGPLDRAAAPAALAVDDGEREMWRVEASAGRARGSGVYDLCFAWSTGAWTLARALD